VGFAGIFQINVSGGVIRRSVQQCRTRITFTFLNPPLEGAHFQSRSAKAIGVKALTRKAKVGKTPGCLPDDPRDHGVYQPDSDQSRLPGQCSSKAANLSLMILNTVLKPGG